jgi:NAD(P)-dependent dehydrogenase (short-subunit alcohol dehydrogenase family)
MATAAEMPAEGELAGKVALVTGAAGGIGSAVTARLLDAGASVVAEDLDPLSAPEGYADRFAAVRGDAAQASTARAAVDAAITRFGRLDILVNLAGRFLGQSILDTSDEAWDALMAANVRSVFVHCREAVPALLAGGGGAIVTAGSISGQVGMAQQAAYGTTKAAVTLLTRQLAVEYASSGLRANVVAPGAIDTAFVARSRPGAAAEPATPEAEEARRRRIMASHPIGRMGTPEEIAEVIVFLASPRASYITGAVISADGGYTAI